MKCTHCARLILVIAILCCGSVSAQPPKDTVGPSGEVSIDKPLYKPFIERYILDELKALRQDHQKLQAELAEKIAEARLDASDRAIRYTADTTNNIFYIITAVATILVLMGWKSLTDIKQNVEAITTQKLIALTAEYEARLAEIEKKMKLRSEQIIANQEEISNTNQIHSLWMRAGLEKGEQDKIAIYDQILEISPDDVEALTYKADSLLELDEVKWSLSLSDRAIEHDLNYSLAYWQRACAKAKLGHEDEAIDDLKIAIDLSETLKEEIANERHFENLRGNPRLTTLLGQKTGPA